ncbi:DUF1236 domain-containing protein [Microvirga sp. VF16]|uniref:DUF1236 domain-containing protein n=1 Tax=Microvirga sp. VF16 TaxID=2807101 RepID=UPI00193E9F08|nr:DUF1236 domain-containing protein [Microvirga sp. VF16]QRM30231.1 DUF1236 domain-containing protein [Microvirga sp. VF16]
MRAAYHLAFAVFSVGTVAAPTTVPNAPDPTTATSSIQSHPIPDTVRNIAADLSARLNAGQENFPVAALDRGISPGESLSETIELYPIPKHETYRYAVVDGHRVIVDATSRKIVYVIQ